MSSERPGAVPLAANPPLPSRASAQQSAAYVAHQHHAVGVRLASAKSYALALAEFDKALTAIPTYAEAWFHRGRVLQELRDPEQAYNAYAQAAILTPRFRDAETKLASLARELSRPVKVLTPWLVAPRPALRSRLAHQISKRVGITKPLVYNPADADEAVLREGLLSAPDSATLATQLGRVFYKTGRHLEAEYFLRYALALEPWSGDAALWLCTALEHFSERRHEIKAVALAALREGSSDPRLAPMAFWNALHGADWQDYDALLSQSLHSLHADPRALGPLAVLHLTTDMRLIRRCMEAFCTEISEGAKPLSPPKRETLRPAKLTIGYLSADFRNHACARLFAELLELHDRRRFTIHGYSTWPDDGSPIGRRVRQSFDKLVDLVGILADEAAQIIRENGVDILVDLTGNTVGARPKILQLRPAPVQISFLGFPGPAGSSGIDYSVVDKIVVPPEHAPYYAEALAYMPNSYQVNDRKRQVAADGAKSAPPAPDGAVVYCCFNHIQKITPVVFDVWMRILAQVPNSVLWFYALNSTVTSHLRQEATRRGIDAGRLLFAGHVPYEEHLARYRHVDLFLDTQPYGAHSTASDALWAGCPVVTLLGKTFAGRVGASLVEAAGLPELITNNWDDYEALAVRVGQDAQFRDSLRRKLAANRATCALFDSRRFCSQFEWALDTMWTRYTEGEKPKSFEVPADAGDARGSSIAEARAG